MKLKHLRKHFLFIFGVFVLALFTVFVEYIDFNQSSINNEELGHSLNKSFSFHENPCCFKGIED